MEKVIAKSYARLIEAGLKTVDDVPENVKQYVVEILNNKSSN